MRLKLSSLTAQRNFQTHIGSQEAANVFMRLARASAFAILLLIGKLALAHEDLDLSIESVFLDQQCRAHVLVKNVGRSLPESFYAEDKAAHVLIKKGELIESLPLLSLIDRSQVLKTNGGQLELISQRVFADNPHHFEVSFNTSGEYLDYGSYNNILRESMDCRVGQGQQAGAPIVYTRADIGIDMAWIEQDCALNLSVVNLTSVALPDTAWTQEGTPVQIKLFDAQSHEPIQTVLLKNLDTQGIFTKSTQAQTWRFKPNASAAEHLKIAIWYVPNDLFFPNNETVIEYPEECRAI